MQPPGTLKEVNVVGATASKLYTITDACIIAARSVQGVRGYEGVTITTVVDSLLIASAKLDDLILEISKELGEKQ